MPEDIDARIVITVESDKAEEASARVKRGIDEIRASREREVRVAEAAAKAELAEYNSKIAAQKAYNAELELQAAIRRKIRAEEKGASSSQLDKLSDNIETARGQYLRLSAASATANRIAVETAASLRDMTSGVGATATTAMSAATKSTKKLTLGFIAAKAAARSLGVAVGRGLSPEMMKMGVIMAGIGAVKSIVQQVIEWNKEDRLNAIDTRNSSLADANAARLAARSEQVGQIDNALSVIQRLQSVSGPLDAAQREEMAAATEKLSRNFDGLNIQIDESTGKIKNYTETLMSSKKKELELQLKDAEAVRKANRASIKTAQGEIKGSGGNFLWWEWNTEADREAIKKHTDEIERATKENNEMDKRVRRLRQQLRDLPRDTRIAVKKAAIAQSNAETAALKKEKRQTTAAENAATRALSGIAAETFKYRATMQGSVEAGSAEAARLQSRILTNTVSPNSPAIRTANGVNALVSQGQKIDQRMATLDQTLKQIASNTGRTASTMSGGRTYP